MKLIPYQTLDIETCDSDGFVKRKFTIHVKKHGGLKVLER